MPSSDCEGLDPELTRLVSRAVPGWRIVGTSLMGSDDAAIERQKTTKAVGYGVPVRVDVEREGKLRSLVLHGTTTNAFGHDRRADRAAELLLAADTFATIPRHTHVLDIGAFRQDGSSVSLANTGEFYLLTNYQPGRPYAEDLRRLAESQVATAGDRERVDVLADYLLVLHSPVDSHPFAYQRSLRDLLGGGEGIFGIVDAYGMSTPGASPERLERIERLCLEWRWRLKQRPPRLRRIHGDFHPFNVLFDDLGELQVLDTSRGSLGDAADDVSCMAVNFVFFALDAATAWRGCLASLWRRFWDRYLEGSRDDQLLSTVAPFLAWRLLVLACPHWYPNLSAAARERLLDLVEAALAQERFEPDLAEAVFR